MTYVKTILVVAILMIASVVQPVAARLIHLLPIPHRIEAKEGILLLPKEVRISDVHQTRALSRFVSEFGSTSTFEDVADAHIQVRYVASISDAEDHILEGYESEAYRLEVSHTGVIIEAVSQLGVIRAAQTLTQMAEGWEISNKIQLEHAKITDWAAFKVRGYMHDVGRSYISVETLKKHIRLLSRFKINTFHWHLTENQAWRFEVKHPAYAKLTNAEYMAASRFPGSYYTQVQCREIEAYAREYGVTIIPEIDMPGHSEAFERALGYTMQSVSGTMALKVILREVAGAFPHAPYIHIGADEKVIERLDWLNGMVRFVKDTLERRCVLWNPIHNIAVSSTMADMTHMWGTRGRAVGGKANIDSRYNYTNHFDVYADLVGIYKSNIYYEAKGNNVVAGTISAAWNDRLTLTEDDIVRQNNFYANVIASSVRAWIGGGSRYIDNNNNGGTNGGGGTMLPNVGAEYEDFRAFETRFLFHKAHSLSEEAKLIPYVKQSNVRWLITDAFPNNGNTAAVFPPEELRMSDRLPTTFEYGGRRYGTRLATGAGIYLRHTWGHNTINGFFDAPTYNQTAYAWTYVYSPEAKFVGTQIEFYNYSRSEKDAVPTTGWDLYGSRIWINDHEVVAPQYVNAGRSITNEVPLTNENFTGRPLIKTYLRKGWNKVFIKLPYKDAAYRLDKWQFTCVFTELDGLKEVDDLVYSPYQELDEVVTLLRAAVNEAKDTRKYYIGDHVGYYSAVAAIELDAALDAAQAALDQPEYSPELFTKKYNQLNAALAAFLANLRTLSVIQPEENLWYDLYTPARGNRYLTLQGEMLFGAASPSERSAWRFVKRADDTWDIISSDGRYLAPTAAYNTALTISSMRPLRGWTIKPSSMLAHVIITSGNVQINQTNAGLGWRVYNWGNGSNTTDGGCQYLVRRSTYQGEITSIAASDSGVATRIGVYFDLLGRPVSTPLADHIYIINGRIMKY